MFSFKIGDRVRRKPEFMHTNGWSADYKDKAGDVFEVNYVSENGIRLGLVGEPVNGLMTGNPIARNAECFDLVVGPKPKFKRGDVVRYASIYGDSVHRVVSSVDIERLTLYTLDGACIAFEDCTVVMRDGRDVVVEPDLSKFDIPIGGI